MKTKTCTAGVNRRNTSMRTRTLYSLRSLMLVIAMTLGLVQIMTIAYSTFTNSPIRTHRKSKLQGTNYDVHAAPNKTDILDRVVVTESKVKLLRGKIRDKKGYLTIGMCSVPRQDTVYLFETLKSLVKNLHPNEKPDVVIVIYLGSNDTEWRNMILTTLDATFTEELESGLFHVVEPVDQSIYPDYRKITRYTYNDNPERVKWRTKQNVDYAYLFSYCENLSNYYLHLEDDVISATDFYGDIQRFVKRQKTYWFFLDFCQLGFIGKLFHSSDLWRIKEYLLLFKTLKPCDFLLDDLIEVMVQPKRIKIPRSLFHHIGEKSTLANKTQHAKDASFKDFKKFGAAVRKKNNDLSLNFKQIKDPNPDADLRATLNQFEDNSPERAYIKYLSGFYWCKDVDKDQFLEVKLKKPTMIQELHIMTGHPVKKSDVIQKADVNVTSATDNDGSCGSVWDNVGHFENGEFHLKFPEKMQLQCLRIVITEKHKAWVIINEITLVS